jgi:uncharacterized protein with HEPN domain
MNNQRSYLDFIEDMLDATMKVSGFIEGMDFQQFKNDDKTVFAVTRALKIIGEAAK